MKKISALTLAVTAASTFGIAQIGVAADTVHAPQNHTAPEVAATELDIQASAASENNRTANTNGRNFIQMFPDLPAFAPRTDASRAAAAEIGAVGGLLDAEDDLSDPLQSIINQPEFSPNNLDNPNMTAGVTFIGQFLDHDITFDRRSPIDENVDPEGVLNERTAAFDLDSVYGGGPFRGGSWQLYERNRNSIKFRVETIPGSENVSRLGVPRLDIPRTESGEAIMGESRNDENSIVSQFHLAMMLFHNAVTDDILADENNVLGRGEVFQEAQRIVQWHYQWIILNEFLPQTIGQDRVDAILRDGLKHYQIQTVTPTGNPVAGTCDAIENLNISSASDDGRSQDAYGPENAIDGIVQPESRWSNQSLGSPKTLELDLGAQRTVSSINIAWFKGDERTASFSIEASADGSNYQTVVPQRRTAGNSLDLQSYAVDNIGAQFIRIIGNGNSSNRWNSIVEVTADGCDLQPGNPGTPETVGPQIPIEFAVAAYRFGHTQVRPSYRLNFGSDDATQFFAFILDIRIDPNSNDPDDLRGGRRAPRRFIDWQTFFDFGDGNVRQNKLIDTKLTTNLFQLPGQVVASPGLPEDGPLSLASRNLIRHVNFGLPSGQDIAREMGHEPLSSSELTELASAGMDESTPLWYYVLKEAEVREEGLRLGDVGGNIVGEVFVGLLQGDDDSYLAVDADWTPTLPQRNGSTGDFRIVDLLEFAGTVFPLE